MTQTDMFLLMRMKPRVAASVQLFGTIMTIKNHLILFHLLKNHKQPKTLPFPYHSLIFQKGFFPRSHGLTIL